MAWGLGENLLPKPWKTLSQSPYSSPKDGFKVCYIINKQDSFLGTLSDYG